MKASTRRCSGRSDSELLIAAGTGDRLALEELYLGYQVRLARFLYGFTRRDVMVEEIINDTFVVVWHQANKFRFASQVSSCIFRHCIPQGAESDTSGTEPLRHPTPRRVSGTNRRSDAGD